MIILTIIILILIVLSSVWIGDKISDNIPKRYEDYMLADNYLIILIILSLEIGIVLQVLVWLNILS